MKISPLFSLVLVMLFLAGCSTVTVREDIASRSDLSGYRTYGWTAVDGGSGDVRATNPEVEKLVVAAVDRYMKRRGVEKVAVDDADCLVSWFGSVKNKVSHQSVAHFYTPYGYGAVASQHTAMVEEGAVARTWREGTLIIDIIDRESKRIVWRGSASNALSDNMTEGDAVAYVDRSVKALLDKLFLR